MNKIISSIILVCLLLTAMFTFTSQVSQSDPEPNAIRVMSYNIHQFFVADDIPIPQKTGKYIHEKLLSVIEEENPHIIGLQEAEGSRLSSGNIQGIAWLAEQLDMYYYYGVSTEDQIYGNAILSEWPILDTDYSILPRPEGIERAVVKVIVDSPFGPLRIFNTHFEIGRFQKAQAASVEFLIDYIGTAPAIITGDFNTAYGNDTFLRLNETYTYAMIESGLSGNSPSGYTASADNPTRKIDYIWLTEGDWSVIPTSYKVVGTPDTSDHLGIRADIIPN